MKEIKETEEIEEIMDEEENNITSNSNHTQIGIGSISLRSLITLYTPSIRDSIRGQIACHIDRKQPFGYYLEMRSFINEGCTKVGMFNIGDGNTESDPDLSLFLYTIPYVFTSDAKIQFLTSVINVTGIHEYITSNISRRSYEDSTSTVASIIIGTNTYK